MGNEDLGSHYHAVGELMPAVKSYGNMRDFCTTPGHIASMCFKIIQVAVDRGDWMGVHAQAAKVKNLAQKPEEQEKARPKVAAAMGLSYMAQGSYRDAATSFISTEPTLGDTFNEVLTSNDVAVYGGLCALASMDRNELQRLVLENTGFRNFLELEPHIRRAISFFCSSKYAQCLEILEAYRTDYMLDIHLHRHVQSIFAEVRSKGIVQYFVPFSCVTLDALATVFAPAEDLKIEDELVEMIEKGKLDARLDLEARLLLAKESEARAAVHADARDMAAKYIQTAHMRLLRMNAINAGLEVKQPNSHGKQMLEGTDMGPGAHGGGRSLRSWMGRA